jgi:hypothetical protein
MFILIIVLFIILRLSAGFFDSDRIERYVENNGGKLVSKEWAPFGTGWFGSKERIYKVFYNDKDGHRHEAYVKTSLFSGVYFTEDRIVGDDATI